ncbi:MAG TPA: lmo0937 family membrane protein [Candidatus Tumulicola sp.]
MAGLLWAIIVVLFVLWLLGFLLHFGGGLIHLILVIVVIMIVINLLTGRGARV